MKILICTLLMLLMSVSAFAGNHVWYDKTAGINTMKKIVVLPIEGEISYNGAYGDFTNELSKRIKEINFTTVPGANTSANSVMAGNTPFKALLQEFPNEAARAKAVEEATAADGYLVCRVREDRVQKEWSPEITCNLEIEEYTEETGGPYGNIRYDEYYYTTSHVVPGQYVYLHLVNLDYTLYNLEGEEILLVQNNAQEYGMSQRDLYKHLFKEFAKELKAANKEKGM